MQLGVLSLWFLELVHHLEGVPTGFSISAWRIEIATVSEQGQSLFNGLTIDINMSLQSPFP
jgi:hypothetical protein